MKAAGQSESCPRSRGMDQDFTMTTAREAQDHIDLIAAGKAEGPVLLEGVIEPAVKVPAGSSASLMPGSRAFLSTSDTWPASCLRLQS